MIGIGRGHGEEKRDKSRMSKGRVIEGKEKTEGKIEDGQRE